MTAQAWADATVLSGTYSVSGSSDAQFCSPQSFEGPDTLTGTVTLTGEADGHFTGSGTTSDNETSFTVSGVLFTNNTFNITIDFQDVDGEVGTLTGSGTFDGSNSLQFTANGSSNFCSQVSVNVSLTRVTESALNPESTQFDAGTEVTSDASLTTFVQGQPVAIGRHTRAALHGRRTGALAYNDGFLISGQAAGDGATGPLGVWFGYSRTNSKNNFTTTGFSSNRNDVLLGFDISPRDTTLIGVSLGLERTSIDTFFNRGEQDTTAITLAPYVGALLNDWLAVDASIGYSDVRTDQFRTSPTTGARVSSDVDSHRLFVNGNVSATHSFGNLLASGQAGLLWARQRDDDFVESDGTNVAARSTRIGRLLLGGEFAYTAGAFEPYLNLLFQHDFSKTRQNFAAGIAAPKNDDNDLLLSLGLRYFGSDGLSASVQYSSLRGRRNVSENSYSAQVRWRF